MRFLFSNIISKSLPAVFDVGDGGLLFFGRDGLLAAGTRMYRYQDLLVKFLSLKSRQVILKSFLAALIVSEMY